MLPSGEIDVCAQIEARGGCDFDAKPYRVSDYLSASDRVRLLTAMARNAAGKAIVCAAAQEAISKYLSVDGTRMGEPVSDRKVAQALLTYVQKDVGYREDPEGEWYQGVKFTLENGGDCEDMAALFVAMAACVGIRAKLVWLEQPKARLNHVTAKVYVPSSKGMIFKEEGPREWQWAEPTIASAKIGQHPYDAAKWHGNSWRLGL